MKENNQEQNKKRRSKILAVALICIIVLCTLILYTTEKIFASSSKFFLQESFSPEELSTERFPLLQLLWTATEQILELITPILLPLLLIALFWLLLFTAKKIHYENKRFGRQVFGETCFIVFDAVLEFLGRFIRHAPVIALILVSAIGLNSIFVSVNRISKVMDNFQRIKELSIMVKNLSRVEDIARITMLKQSGEVGTPIVTKTYKIEILSEDGETVSEQEVVLKGNQIAIDSITVNFEYSEIETGRKQNIAYPYRVYSETMRAKDAVPLKCMFNNENLPVIYCLESNEIYGLSKDTFLKRLKELFAILQDESLSREMGIRSANGTVNHFIMKQGEICTISVEATGGLSVHRKLSLE